MTESPGWYVIRTSTGAVGLVLHHGSGAFDLGSKSNGTVTRAIYLADSSQTMPDLVANMSAEIVASLEELGANAKQSTDFVVQADAGAGKQQTNGPGLLGILTLGFFGGGPSSHQTTQLLLAPSGKATASSGQQPVSTTPSGDTQYTGPSVPSSWMDALTNILNWIGTASNWLRVLEFVGGAVMIGIAMRELANT